jgi:hypothetical protein
MILFKSMKILMQEEKNGLKTLEQLAIKQEKNRLFLYSIFLYKLHINRQVFDKDCQSFVIVVIMQLENSIQRKQIFESII